MRLYRNAAILVVVLGLLVGAYFFVSNKKGTDASKDSGASQTIKVWELDKDKISQVSIEGKNGKIVIDNKDKKLALTEPSNLKYDDSKLQDIVSNAASVNADKVVEENASDLAQFGLDKPTVLTVKMQDGIAKTGQIGDATPSNTGYYFKEKENNKIYAIATSAGQTLMSGKNDLKDKKLFTEKAEDITGFTLEKAGKTVFSAKKNGTAWDLLKPFEGNADASKLQEMFQLTLQSNISSFVDENAGDLDKYGLKQPAYSIELDSNAGKKKLLIGSEKEAGVEFYAKLADGSDVFTIGETNLNYLDRPLKEIIDAFVYIVNIDDVSKIELDMDGTKAVADVSTDKDNKENDKFSINGKSVMNVKSGNNTGDGLFRVLYQAVIGVTLDSIDTDAKPTGKPYLTINYTLKKAPGTIKIEYIAKDDKSFYALKNGQYTNIVVSKKDVDHVKETYKNLIDAVEKAK